MPITSLPRGETLDAAGSPGKKRSSDSKLGETRPLQAGAFRWVLQGRTVSVMRHPPRSGALRLENYVPTGLPAGSPLQGEERGVSVGFELATQKRQRSGEGYRGPCTRLARFFSCQLFECLRRHREQSSGGNRCAKQQRRLCTCGLLVVFISNQYHQSCRPPWPRYQSLHCHRLPDSDLPFVQPCGCSCG